MGSSADTPRLTAASANAAADTADFEFAALNEARNYRAALVREFREALRGRVLEIGAGIGQITAALRSVHEVDEVVGIEPDARFHETFRRNNPGVRLIAGLASDLPDRTGWDAVVAVNVLEHIEKDEDELRAWREFLAARRGRVCLFVPARPEIYAPLDKDFGHYRRYTKPDLREKLTRAGFRIERLHYFNCVGYFAWWLKFCVQKQRHFEPGPVRFYDRVIFPVVHGFERAILRPPFGQSLLAIGRAE